MNIARQFSQRLMICVLMSQLWPLLSKPKNLQEWISLSLLNILFSKINLDQKKIIDYNLLEKRKMELEIKSMSSENGSKKLIIKILQLSIIFKPVMTIFKLILNSLLYYLIEMKQKLLNLKKKLLGELLIILLI